MYDWTKDHGGYRGKKPGGMMESVVVGALIIGGQLIWDGIKSWRQKKLWNKGICAKCGRKWRYHWYYPKGSRGQYKRIHIDCDNCRIHEDLDAYTPKTVS